VVVTYDKASKTLFSADGFGKFGANDVEDPEGWDCEARRYYIGIVGKYGPQTQALLKKASGLDIARICPLHGPVIDTPEDIAHVVKQYDTWSSYSVESPGVCICYTSVYGHTKAAVMKLKELLLAKGCPKVAVSDLARDDQPEAVEDAFRYGTLVLATTTYNMDIFPWMRHFIDHLTERNYQKRRVAFIENGSWAPVAAKVMKGMFANSREIEFVEPVVTIRSALNEASEAQLAALADALV
jgi:flavorubredoxin